VRVGDRKFAAVVRRFVKLQRRRRSGSSYRPFGVLEQQHAPAALAAKPRRQPAARSEMMAS